MNASFTSSVLFGDLKSAIVNKNFELLKQFLQRKEYAELINHEDILEDGKTLLHLAASPERRDGQMIKLLLAHGADPVKVDNDEKIPLHYVVSEGTGCFCKNCTEKAEECTRILLEANSKSEVVNKKSKSDSKTPLYYAADSKLSNCAILLLNHGADINICPHEAEDLVTWLLKQIPEVFETILDQSMEVDNAASVGQIGRILKVDFGLFLGEPKSDQRPRNVQDLMIPRREGDFLHRVLSLSKFGGRNKILGHPVTELFVYKKERALQIAFLLPQIFRFALALTYTFFVFGFYLYNCPYYPNQSNLAGGNATFSSVPPEIPGLKIPFTDFVLSIQILNRAVINGSTEVPEEIDCHPWGVVKMLCGLTSTFSGIMLLYSIIKLFVKPKYYIQSSSYWLWILFLVFSLVTLMPVYTAGGRDEDSGISSFYYPTAAVGTFLIWSLLLRELGRIPSVGVHLEMLNKVIRTVLFCVFAYGLLVLAFAFGFHIMFPKNELFSSPYLSFVKVLMIMVGDTDYNGIFKERPTSKEDLLYWIPAHMFYAAFLILITIIFMNLLVGLAVSDIQKLKEKAVVAKTIGFIELLNLVEIHLYSDIWDSPLLSWAKKFLFRLKRSLAIVGEKNGDIVWHIEIPTIRLQGRADSSFVVPFRSDELPEKLHFKLMERYRSSCTC